MKRDELFIIKQAILNEIEGCEFYKMAEKQADNEEAKESFLILASEEMKHAEYLKELFDKMEKDDEDLKLAYLLEPPSPHIFDWTKNKFKRSAMNVSIYGMAVNLEKESVEFYEDARDKTENSEARKLFDILVKWEKVHLEQFLKAYETSMDEWWKEQGYEPF
ncbi:Rubrerythrin [Dethiosulfatibacter aminovorans DSM 17477]|uniref:Rubrerythrin n=1 Tax=Dethiosulfatibacter aminovorans DSM 17477 TaxID=1121476 RepID=A0A1M6H6N4_9FIRM|nr:ferritin family protein [Dethiosulfatibacter aminovorans]SHJ17850.1 Rubrerythrin [Dethiosulfatibacter aminovorans DSM 17477]